MNQFRARIILRTAGVLAAVMAFCAVGEGAPAPLSSAAVSTAIVRDESAPASEVERIAAVEAQLEVERETLASMARDLAITLHDPVLRMRLKGDLRISRFTREHKLPLQTYLRDRGASLLTGMARATAKKAADITESLSDLRRMEIYMPVPAHRESWTGGEDLIVAWQLVEEDAPVGYRTDGSEVVLSNDSPPKVPTIVIVPAETDFSKPLSNEWQNSRDRGGSTIGTYTRAASTLEEPLLTAESVTYPSGVYLQSSHLLHDGEDWPRGAPEIEAFVIGPTFHPENQGELISCAGQGALPPRYFDQNSYDWSSPVSSVEGLFLTREEIDQYHQIYNAPYSILFWEDDQDACEIVDTGRSEMQQLFDNLRAAARATTLIFSILNGGVYDPVTGRITLNPGAGNALRAILPEIWQSDDDFLGNLVYRPGSTRTRCSGTYTVGDLELPEGNNGWVEIRTVEPSSDDPPIANFSWQCTDLNCSFYSTSSDCNGISAWSWAFGDGTTDSGPGLNHTFPFEGTFPVTLTVTDTVGQTSQRTQSIAVRRSVCGNAWCENGENSINCPDDCGTCGNFVCDSGDDYNCPDECAICGNYICESGEDHFNCSMDCCVPGECQ